MDDRASSSLRKDPEELSGGRGSSSDPKGERPTSERRTRARRGSMRDYSSNSDDDYEATRRRRNERRHSSDTKPKKHLSDFHYERPDPISAAKTKANRERQRRERLNDSFADLVKTLDNDGLAKAEKPTIIAASIRALNGQRKEINEMRHKVEKLDKEKRDAEFQRAMVERQLQDLQSSIYSGGIQPPLGGQAELANQIKPGPLEMTQSSHASPNGLAHGGLARMLQEQASLQSNEQQPSLEYMESQMYPRITPQTSQPLGRAFMPMPGSQAMDQPMHPSGNLEFDPNGGFLDMELAASLPDPDTMSMSPIIWLNETLGPEANESYMCSNL